MKTSSPKNIDRLFSEKLEEAEYSHNESAWTLMEYLMRQKKQKRKLFFIRFFSVCAALAAFLYIWLLFSPPLAPPVETHNYASLPEYPADDATKIPTISQNNNEVELAFAKSFSEAMRRMKRFGGVLLRSPAKDEARKEMKAQNNFSTLASSPAPRSPFGTNSHERETRHPARREKNLSAPFNFSSSPSEIGTNLFADSGKINSGQTEGSPVPLPSGGVRGGLDGLDYLESSSHSLYIPWEKDSIKILIKPTGKELNTPYPEYAPVINADGSVMYFTSRRPVTEKEKKKGIQGTENIYFSSYNTQSQTWSQALLLPAPINFPGRFNSAAALSNDGQRLFLYRDDKFGNGDIYESVLQGNLWSEPQLMPEPINSPYHESSVTLSPDGNTIYFVSNRPGGQGNLDIWYSVKTKDGKWGEAKNSGSAVNSSKDEEAVFMHPDGKTLYFSSRGHSGRSPSDKNYGGYDIFYSRLENGNWKTPVNLGPAINTPNDDVYFVVEANGQHAYYASVRQDGLGEKDIYKITFVSPKEKKKPVAQLTLFKGNVLDKLNKQPLESDIELIDLEKGEQITTLKSNAATGAFMLSLPAGKNYAINVKKQGYLFYSENFNIPSGDEYKEVCKAILLDELRTGAKVVLKNIFYDYDKATLRPESAAELNRLYELMLQNPNLKIELSAHTDSRGSNDYNLNLSQDRSQNCINYLIGKGIGKDKIVAKGYGEQQPFIQEEDINKMSSEKEKETAHQLNRRTEIKIIEN